MTAGGIELLKETGYISEKEFSSLSLDAIELIKLITSIIKTTKKNIASNWQLTIDN